MPTKQYIKKLNGYYIKDEEARQKMIETSGVTATDYGATGDGTTDDTEAINAAIQACSQSGISLLTIPEGTYVISGELTIPSNMTIRGSAGTIIKYVGDGNSGYIFNIAGTDADHPVTNVTIENVIIDGTDQVYKGGYSMDTPKVTHTNPGFKGLGAFKAKYAKNLTIENCTVNDLYGDGIIVNYSTDVNIVGNSLYDVGAGNITQNGQTGYDNHGDGIVAFSSYNVNIERNTVVNKRVYQDGMAAAIGKVCGRSGLEFEYHVNVNAPDGTPNDPEHNAPGYSDLPLDSNDRRAGIGLRARNNYVYGYTKGIHIESWVKCQIVHNTILFSHVGVIASVPGQSSFDGNYFNDFDIGPAPQSGYDGYYGGIAITEYSANENRYGINIINNTFEGTGCGVRLGSSHVTISGNKFFGKMGIQFHVQHLSGIRISNNTFNNANASEFMWFLQVYQAYSAYIVDNDFYSVSATRIQITGSNITFSRNHLVNTVVNNNQSGSDFTAKDNRFEGTLFEYAPFFITAKKFTLEGNSFYLANVDGVNAITVYSKTNNARIVANRFYVSAARSVELIRNESIEDSNISDNEVFGNGPSAILIHGYEFKRDIITNNRLEDQSAIAIKSTGGFWRWNIVDNNKGKLSTSNYKPNNSLARLVNEFYANGQKLYKYDVSAASTTIGWICTTEGWYVTTAWSATTFATGALVKNSSDNVYRCLTAGEGAAANEPTNVSGSATGEDGYEWEYLGPVATFNELTI